jgi:DnaA family protein
VKPLSDVQKMDHLRAEAGRRGLQLGEDVVAYLLTRLPRDLYSLNSFLDLLDRESLAKQRPLTIPLVREALTATRGRAFLPRQNDTA